MGNEASDANKDQNKFAHLLEAEDTKHQDNVISLGEEKDRVLRESLVVKGAQEELVKSQQKKQEQDLAEAKDVQDEAKKAQLQAALQLEEEKLRKEKSDINTEKMEDSHLKSVENAKQETAAALKAAAEKASEGEDAALAKKKALDQGLHEAATNQAIDSMLAKVNIAELVKRSKKAMAKAVLHAKAGGHAAAGTTPDSHSDAAKAVMKAEETTKRKALETASSMKESTKEVGQKA